MTAFDTSAATHLLNTAFAPWVQELDLSVESLSKDGAIIRMRFSDSSAATTASSADSR